MSSAARIDVDEEVFEAIFDTWFEPPSSRARARAAKATERPNRYRPGGESSPVSPSVSVSGPCRKRASPSPATPTSPRLRPLSATPPPKSRRTLARRNQADKWTPSRHKDGVHPSRVATVARVDGTTPSPVARRPHQGDPAPAGSSGIRKYRKATPRCACGAEAAQGRGSSTEDDELELEALEDGDAIGEEEATAMLSSAYAGDCVRSQHRAKAWLQAGAERRAEATHGASYGALRLADQDVEEAPLHSEFTVVDPAGSLFTVSVARVVCCTCGGGATGQTSPLRVGALGEGEGHSLCAHRRFVMHRVFCLPPGSPLALQDALVARERRLMDERRPGLSRVMLAQPRVMRAVAALAGRRPLYQRQCELADAPTVARKPLDRQTACPVCFHTLDGPTESITWCRDGCGSNVHNTCFEQWKSVRREERKPLVCVVCRCLWSSSWAGGTANEGAAAPPTSAVQLTAQRAAPTVSPTLLLGEERGAAGAGEARSSPPHVQVATAQAEEGAESTEDAAA